MLKNEPRRPGRTMILCVDSYADGVLQGRFIHSGSKESCTFNSLSQFLWKAELLLNELAAPQSFNALRGFDRTGSAGTPPFGEVSIPNGKLATFSIRILFRQNASWQGSVRWMESGREQRFRSALELIFLMDSALTGVDEREVV